MAKDRSETAGHGSGRWRGRDIVRVTQGAAGLEIYSTKRGSSSRDRPGIDRAVLLY